MRITRRVLFLVFPVLVAGCKGTENIQGTPSEQLQSRTIASMQPSITRSLTAQKAVDTFGTPSSMSTSGEIVLVYNVEDAKKVSLGFPSLEGLIAFARVTDRTGVSTDLQILP